MLCFVFSFGAGAFSFPSLVSGITASFNTQFDYDQVI